MLKIDYRDPMSKTFQYEYILYMLLSEMFHSVTCASMCIDTLKLHYMDLVTTNKSGNPSYEKQYVAEKMMMGLIKRDLKGKIRFPHMHLCSAKVFVIQIEDGSHVFLFSDGIYAFALHLEMDEKTRSHVKKISIKNYRVSEPA